MRSLLFGAVALACALPASAQEVSIPAVTTASPGGYANPLKLDTDRYKAEKGTSGRSSAPARHGRCHNRSLTAKERQNLEAGYRAQAARAGHHGGYRWLRDQCGATSAIQIQRTARRGASAR